MTKSEEGAVLEVGKSRSCYAEYEDEAESGVRVQSKESVARRGAGIRSSEGRRREGMEAKGEEGGLSFSDLCTTSHQETCAHLSHLF